MLKTTRRNTSGAR